MLMSSALAPPATVGRRAAGAAAAYTLPALSRRIDVCFKAVCAMANAVYIALPLWQYRSELPSEVRWTLCPTVASGSLALAFPLFIIILRLGADQA